MGWILTELKGIFPHGMDPTKLVEKQHKHYLVRKGISVTREKVLMEKFEVWGYWCSLESVISRVNVYSERYSSKNIHSENVLELRTIQDDLRKIKIFGGSRSQ